jgi:hypothetical protein
MLTCKTKSWEARLNLNYATCFLFDFLTSGDFLTEPVDSFNAPFLNRYFQRVWTVQEIAMAHRLQVHYGAQIISWRDFVASGLFAVKRGGFARYQEAVTDVFLHSELHWNLINSLESHFVLPDIFGVESLSDKRKRENILNRYTPGTAELALIKSKGLSATEPKDKAYAMLWAFPELTENTAPLRNVDYKKPIELIYTEYTTALFVKMNGSSFPFYWVNSRPRNASLPSWVPDWKEQTSMSFFVWGGKLRDFRAAKEDSLRHRIEIDGGLLRISGVNCSNVKGIIRPSEEVRYRDLQNAGPGALLEGLIDVTELVNSLIDVSRSHTSIPEEELLGVIHRVVHSQKRTLDPGPADLAEYFANAKEAAISEALNISVGLLRIRVFDKLRFLYDETTILEHETKNALASFLLEHETEVVLQGARQLPNLPPFFAVICALAHYIDVYNFLNIVLLDHRDKDFFVTSDDRLGVVFQGLKSGDLVTILQGCPSPMVVRKSEIESRITYQLLGTCLCRRDHARRSLA